MGHWGWNVAGCGAVLVVVGALAVLSSEGPVGLRHPLELSGILGHDPRRARWSHYLLLAGLALIPVGLVAVFLGALGW
jgi:hypothetical protein